MSDFLYKKQDLNNLKAAFSDLMTPGEAIKYMLKLGVPTNLFLQAFKNDRYQLC